MNPRRRRLAIAEDRDDAVAPSREICGERRVYWEAAVGRWVELWPAHQPSRSTLLPSGAELDAPKDGQEHLVVYLRKDDIR